MHIAAVNGKEILGSMLLDPPWFGLSPECLQRLASQLLLLLTENLPVSDVKTLVNKQVTPLSPVVIQMELILIYLYA